MPMKTASIDLSATGEIAAAVSGHALVVTSLALVADAALTVELQDTDGAALIGPVALAAKTPFVLPGGRDARYAITASGKGLQLAITGTGQVGGSVSYRQARSA